MQEMLNRRSNGTIDYWNMNKEKKGTKNKDSQIPRNLMRNRSTDDVEIYTQTEEEKHRKAEQRKWGSLMQIGRTVKEIKMILNGQNLI